MAEEGTPTKAADGVDAFLIAEYQHFADSFWRTEELGEKRLNFFISLVTAAVAGLVVLATSDVGFTRAQVQWVAFAAGLALLLLGLSTLLRMLRRNNVADQYKRAINLVRENFRDRYELGDYRPFDTLPRRLFTGGLAQTAALLNSMIAAALAAIALVAAARPAVTVIAAAAVFAVSLTAQFLYIDWRHKR